MPAILRNLNWAFLVTLFALAVLVSGGAIRGAPRPSVHATAGWRNAAPLAPGFSGAGANYYVSTAGNDGNPGTIDEPWRTSQHAANTVAGGDTVYVRGGVYNEHVNVAVSGNRTAGY